MKIRVDEVKSINGETSIVFSTNVGTAVAVWQGEPPRIGEEHDVELGIDTEFQWGGNANVSESDYSLKVQGETIVLDACLLSIDEDGVAVIDLDGAKALIELTGPVPRPPFSIQLSFEGLNLYPTYV